MAPPLKNVTGDAGDEEDYMSMLIPEPTTFLGGESSIQRRARRQREGEIKGRAKSKKEQEAEAAAAREAALNTALDTSNKGFRMMAKLGYKPGDTLGKSVNARIEPVHLVMKEDRGGVGLDSEKKRKFREQFEGEAKRTRSNEGDYVERVRKERACKRAEQQFYGAMKAAERLDNEAEEKGTAGQQEKDQSARADQPPTEKPLRSINVVWRGLVRGRREKEKERRLKHDLYTSLSRLPTYEDPDEDDDDKRALGLPDHQLGSLQETASVFEDIEDDPELDEFNALEPTERLKRAVEYLREKHRYCFWCKYQYPDDSMEGCPGLTEDEHD